MCIRKGVWHEISLRMLLEAIVANGACGIQTFPQVAAFEDQVLVSCAIGPYPNRQTPGSNIRSSGRKGGRRARRMR